MAKGTTSSKNFVVKADLTPMERQEETKLITERYRLRSNETDPTMTLVFRAKKVIRTKKKIAN